MKLENYPRVQEIVKEIQESQVLIDKVDVLGISVTISQGCYEIIDANTNINGEFTELASEFVRHVIKQLKNKISTLVAELETL